MAIKVRVLRNMQAGLTGLSGLAALSGVVTACTAPQAPADDVGSSTSAVSVQDPGNGVFQLGWDYTTPVGYSFSAKNSTDEYVRAGETMTFAIPSYFLWQRLYPTLPTPDDLTRLKQLSAEVKVIYVKDGAIYGSASVTTNGTFQGTQTYDLAALTSSFVVHMKAQSIRFEIAISDAADATKTTSVTAAELTEFPVFGGSIPNKTALFDSLGSAMRQRIVEGGKPVAGANLTIGYTDWRAATLVDSGAIDRTIGNATSYSRFGTFQMPILGDLEYEVTYGYAIDNAWQAEQALAPNAKSRLMPPNGRVAYEGTLPLPAGAGKLDVYFHVKTFLVVNYDKFTNVGWRKYQQGQRLLVREKWDNANGVVNQNYDFSTETP